MENLQTLLWLLNDDDGRPQILNSFYQDSCIRTKGIFYDRKKEQYFIDIWGLTTRWSLNVGMVFRNGSPEDKIYSLQEACDKFNLTMHLYSEEPDNSFTELVNMKPGTEPDHQETRYIEVGCNYFRQTMKDKYGEKYTDKNILDLLSEWSKGASDKEDPALLCYLVRNTRMLMKIGGYEGYTDYSWRETGRIRMQKDKEGANG